MTPADTATTVTAQLGRPVGANGADTRRRIITAAMRCVAEKGYSQASIREIAREAQMTSGSLYHYFPNKSELLKATVEEIEAIALPRLRAAGQHGADVIGRLEALLDESDRLMREYPYLATFERAIRAESASYLRRGDPERLGFQALREIIAGIVDDALQRGEMAAHSDPAGTVDAIYALTRGLTEQATNLAPNAYHAALRSAKHLIRGTLFSQQLKPARGQRP
jgi:AcrR family transcriptional regulator